MTTRLPQGTPFGAQPNVSQSKDYFNASQTADSDPFSFVHSSAIQSTFAPPTYLNQSSNTSQASGQVEEHPPLGHTPQSTFPGGQQPPFPPPSAHGGTFVPFPSDSSTQPRPPQPSSLLPTVDTPSQPANDPRYAPTPLTGFPPPPSPQKTGTLKAPVLSQHARSVSVPAASGLFMGIQGGDSDDFFSSALSSKSNVTLSASHSQSHLLKKEESRTDSGLGGHSMSELCPPAPPSSTSAGELRRASYAGPEPASGSTEVGAPPSSSRPPANAVAFGGCEDGTRPIGIAGGSESHPHHVATDYGVTFDAPTHFADNLDEGSDGRSAAALEGGSAVPPYGRAAPPPPSQMTGGWEEDQSEYGSDSRPRNGRDASGSRTPEDSYELKPKQDELKPNVVPGLMETAGGGRQAVVSHIGKQNTTNSGSGGDGGGVDASPAKSVVSLLNSEEDFATLSPIKLLPPTVGPQSAYDSNGEHATFMDSHMGHPSSSNPSPRNAAEATASERQANEGGMWTTAPSTGPTSQVVTSTSVTQDRSAGGINRVFAMGSSTHAKEAGAHSWGSGTSREPFVEPPPPSWNSHQPADPDQHSQPLGGGRVQTSVQPLWSHSEIRPHLQSQPVHTVQMQQPPSSRSNLEAHQTPGAHQLGDPMRWGLELSRESGPEQSKGYTPGLEQPRSYPQGPEQPRGYPQGPEQPRGYPQGPEQPRGYPQGPEQPRGYPQGPEQPRGYPQGPEQPRGYPQGPEQPRGYPQGPEQSRRFPSAPDASRRYPMGPELDPREYNLHRDSNYVPSTSLGEHYHQHDAYGGHYKPPHPSEGQSHYLPYHQEEADYYRPRTGRYPQEDWGYGHPSRHIPPPFPDYYYYDYYDMGYADPYFRDPYDPYYGLYDYDPRYAVDHRFAGAHESRQHEGPDPVIGGRESVQVVGGGGARSEAPALEASSIYGNQGGTFEETRLEASAAPVQQQTSSHFDMLDYMEEEEDGGNQNNGEGDGGNQSRYDKTQYEESGEQQIEMNSQETSFEGQLSSTPPVPRRGTPEIFYNPHVTARFGIGGQLVVVLPDVPSADQRGLVVIHSLSGLLGGANLDAEEGEGLEEPPGPFVPGETPKSAVVRYAQAEAERCHSSALAADDEEGRRLAEDEALLWDFLVLLCQQNGVLVPSDVAELLLGDKGAHLALSKMYGQSKHVGANLEEALDEFRRRLLAGRKKDALELACARCLWGHALMLSSGMDEQSRTYVVNRFTASLVTTDPLFTFYTLLLGRTPSSVKPEGLQRAGNWRPHLAMILTNQNSKVEFAAILSLGDALLAQGSVCAAHLCYLLAHVQLGACGDKGARYSLLGTRQEELLAVGACPSLSQLRMTEVYEYAMTLGKQDFALPSFQTYKYIHMLRLVEQGFATKALMYCESVARVVVKCIQDCKPALLLGLSEFSVRLYYATSPAGIVEQELPSWILQLHQAMAKYSSPDSRVLSPSNQMQGPVPILDREGLPDHNPQPIIGLGQYLLPAREGSSRASSLQPSMDLGNYLSVPRPLTEGSTSQSPMSQQKEDTQQPQQPSYEGEVAPSTTSVPTYTSFTGLPQDLFSSSTQQPVKYSNDELNTDSSFGQMQFTPSQFNPSQFNPSQFNPSQFNASQFNPSHAQIPYNVAQSGDQTDPSSGLTGAGLPVDGTAGFQSTYDKHSESYQAFGEPTVLAGAQSTPFELNYGQGQGMPASSMAHQEQAELVAERRELGTQNEIPQQGKMLQVGSEKPRGTEKPPQAAPATKSAAPQVKDRTVEKKAEAKSTNTPEKRGSIVGNLFKYLIPASKKEAHLPSDDNKRIIYDKEKKKWVNLDEKEQEQAPLPPPPTDLQLHRGSAATLPPAAVANTPLPNMTAAAAGVGTLQPTVGSGGGGVPTGPQSTPDATSVLPTPSTKSSIYSMRSVDTRRLGARSKYVDVLNPRGSGPSSSAGPAPVLPPMGGLTQSFSGKLFVPQPGGGGGGGSTFEDGYGTSGPGGTTLISTQAATTLTATAGETPASSVVPSSESQPPVQAFGQRSGDQAAVAHGSGGVRSEWGGEPVAQGELGQQPPVQSHSGPVTVSVSSEGQQVPQFFNPNAFGPMQPGMLFSAGSEMADDRTYVSGAPGELAHEVKKNATKPQEVPPAQQAGYNKLKHGLRARQQPMPQPQGQVRPVTPGNSTGLRPPGAMGFPQK